MNDNAIQQAYQVFSQGGYNGSIDDFKQLISTNQNALNASYNAFKSGGYADDINTFKTLMGVDGSYPIKKKVPMGFQLRKVVHRYLQRVLGLQLQKFQGVVWVNMKNLNKNLLKKYLE